MWQQVGISTVMILLWVKLSKAENNITSSDTVMRDELRKFPEGMLFGVSTSSYQIEGDWNASDRGENIWDHIMHTEPWQESFKEKPDISTDSFHNYKRDVQMMRELGVNFYRFSLSWTRILPTGFSNYISKDGVAYYNRLIDELLKYNITPVATLYHFDLPQSLQSLGGWINPLIVNWFDDYARIAFEQFGDRVKNWLTINEPYEQCEFGYGSVQLAPFLNVTGIGNYLCTHNQLKAHAAVYRTYNETYRATQKGRIGFTVHIIWGEPASDNSDDIQAAEEYNQFRDGLYYNPICGSGDYPSIVKSRIAAKSEAQGFPRSRLPEFTKEDIEYIKGTYDFVGLNHYTTHFIYRNSSVNGMYPVPSISDDIGAGYFFKSSWETEIIPDVRVVPWGLRKSLNFIKKNCNSPEIHIYENGYAGSTELIDNQRINFYRTYLAEVMKAIHDDHVNVTAYAAWTLMDNWEWSFGFRVKFGMYQVNFTDPHRTRTLRKSGLVYKQIIKSKVIDQGYDPDMNTLITF